MTARRRPRFTATVRNAAGEHRGERGAPVAGRSSCTIVNGATTMTSIPVEPSPQVSTTGANGTATTVVRAPIAPDVMPSGQVMLRVAATPIGDDASQPAPVSMRSRAP